MSELISQFEKRKRDHLQWSLHDEAQALGLNHFDSVQLIPEALPDLNLDEVSTQTSVFGKPVSLPIFVSSMTAGHADSLWINMELALLSQERRLLMGVGSQRRELHEPEALNEWSKVRKVAPQALLMGNLGISQVIHTPLDKITELLDRLQAIGLFVHLNALQECLQAEGTPQFRGSWLALEKLVKNLSVPVVVKEVGCGFSSLTLKRLAQIGVTAVDVSGAGGTHWGRVETLRLEKESQSRETGEVFQNWGLSTVQSLINAQEAQVPYQVWASGGVRSGLDAAKCLALGARMVGVAQPWMKTLLQNPREKAQESLHKLADRYENELKISLFCTGCASVDQFMTKKAILWKRN